jgi:antitoxin (DNA-binding transcriptional repressor) of toxin-antitoxin stability system
LAWWLCQHTTVRRRRVSERLRMGDELRVTHAIRRIKTGCAFASPALCISYQSGLADNSHDSNVGVWPDSDDNCFMQTVTLDEAQKHLADLVRELARGGEVLITEAEKPVAKLSAVTATAALTSIHVEVEAITGLVPPDGNPEAEYHRHLLDKHR